MKRTKSRICIIALALVFVLSAAAFFAVNFKPVRAASSVSVGSSNVFVPSGKGSSVIVDRQATGETEEDGSAKYEYYTMFQFGYEGDSISYKRNLAYNWYEQVTEEIPAEGEEAEGEEGEEKEPTIVKKLNHGLFNMEIGFKNTNFKRFIITFESQQFTKTKDGKSVNYIIFFPDGEDAVKVLVTDDKDASEEKLEDNRALVRDHIFINFTEKLEGEYRVEISGKFAQDQVSDVQIEGFLKNVGGNYAKASSSSTTPVSPLTFNAELNDDGENENEENRVALPRMVLYCLNNQRFLVRANSVTQEGDHWIGGSVNDDTPAVLCLNKNVSYLERGGSISFDYQLIDVLRTSPTAQLYYYKLTCDDEKANDIDFNDNEDIYDKKKNKNGKFKEVESNILLESDVNIYLPELGKDGGEGYGKEFEIDSAVKVFAKIQDTTNSGETSYVFLDWYISPELKLSIGTGEDKYDFIAVGKNTEGVRFNYDNEDGTWSDEDNGVRARYQAKVDEAAKNLSAGSSSYFYVPSAEELFKDDTTAYTDMKISVYYYGPSKSSNTSLAYNNLSINVTKPGKYFFTLYATDANGNSMYYIDKDEKDDDGEYKHVELAASEIWDMYEDEDLRGYLPWFEFYVDYKGVEFKEEPAAQNTAHVGSSYNSASFDINGVDGTYSVKYRLFLFDSASYFAAFKEVPSYEEFLKIKDDLFENEATAKYFNEIKEVNESDEDYEKYKDYNWKSSSTSFTPQDGNAFYYMRAEVTDTAFNTEPITCSLAVVASKEARALKGDSQWLKNNVASVILLSVAGVSLAAIVLLLVIKPKNKEDIDVQFEKEKKKSK